MDDKTTVTYEGRVVPIEGFRVYVYGCDGATRLANTYHDYVALTSGDEWFTTAEEVPKKKPSKKGE